VPKHNRAGVREEEDYPVRGSMRVVVRKGRPVGGWSNVGDFLGWKSAPHGMRIAMVVPNVACCGLAEPCILFWTVGVELGENGCKSAGWSEFLPALSSLAVEP